jgi:hypothetical protein
MSTKIMTFGLPAELGREVVKAAKAEGQTVPELVTKAIRQYRALRVYKTVAAEGRRLAKKRGLTEKEFEATLGR